MSMKKMVNLFLALVILSTTVVSADDFVIRADQVRHTLTPFWRGTGFTPADLLERDDMQQQVIYWGGVPHRNIEYVRPHDMLDLVNSEGWETGQPQYDWSRLDAALDVLVQNRQKMFFELMGEPGKAFEDIMKGRREVLQRWQQFVHDLAVHLMQRYGREEVESWYFETWNEPDLKRWGGEYKHFLKYYDACWNGLKSANENLRFGGPGNAYVNANLFKLMLAHSKYNRWGDPPGPGIDFISVHEKGGQYWQTHWPSAWKILNNAKEGVRYLRENYPDYRHLPFINNEADPVAGWSKDLPWRVGPFYSAFIARVVNMHQVELVENMGVDYVLHHNDNAFMGNWEERTYFARFEHNGGFAMIKQPSLTVMEMMSLLGDETLHMTNRERLDSNVNILPTRRGEDQIVLMVYNCADDYRTTGRSTVPIRLRGLPFEKATMVQYAIDQDHSNPYPLWVEMGRPEVLSAQQLSKLRENMELERVVDPKEVSTAGGEFNLDLEQPLPGLTLVILTLKPEQPPEQVEDVRIRLFPGVHGPERMISWKPLDSRNIMTYQIEFSASKSGPWKRINGPDLISGAFIESPAAAEGYYRISAVDYWGRQGEPSTPVHSDIKE